MPTRWYDIPLNDWVSLNAQLRRALVALQAQGTWTDPVTIGGSFLWVDASGRLRIKGTAPTSITDGTVVGTQT